MKNKRWNHTAAFNANVAIREDKPMAELAGAPTHGLPIRFNTF